MFKKTSFIFIFQVLLKFLEMQIQVKTLISKRTPLYLNLLVLCLVMYKEAFLNIKLAEKRQIFTEKNLTKRLEYDEKLYLCFFFNIT